MKVDSILDKFTAYCNPRKNITFLRYQFFSYSQSEGQQFDHFVTSLKKRAADCEFVDLRDSLNKDRLVCGTNDSKLRERYLRESELTLEKAVQLGQAAEETRKHAAELQPHSIPHPVYAINTTPTSSQKTTTTRADYFEQCRFCGRAHRRGNCFAYNKRCNACGALHHLARFCTKAKPAAPPSRRAVHEVSTTVQNPDDEPEFFVGEVNANPTAEDSDFEWTTLLETNGTLTKFKLDTGSQVNLLPKSAYQRLRTRPKLHATTVKLTAYNGTSIPVA